MSATLLLVHEDQQAARVHAETLEAEGFDVVCVFDGRHALDALRDRRPSFVLLDALLPRMDGFEILAEMRADESLRSIPVLLLSSGDVTPEERERAKRFGAIGIESMPVAPDRLVARVLAATKSGIEGAAGERCATIPSAGTLRDLPVPELFHGLRRMRFDGVLLLEHGKKKKAVEWREGWPAAVRSNLRSECLDHHLVREGLIDKRALDASSARVRAGEGMQGQILVAMEVLDEETLVEALRKHALEKFFELFTWRDGRFALRPGKRVQRGSSIAIEGHPAGLFVEGVRRAFPLKQIDRFFGNHASAYLAPVEGSESDFEALATSEEERAWVSKLDGRVRLGELCKAPEWLKRFAFALISIEVLGVAESAADEGAARAFAARASGTPASPPTAQDAAARTELAEFANRLRGLDHYGVLGVDRDASDDEIEVSFASLSKRTHPDRYRTASSSVRQLAAQVQERLETAFGAIGTEEGRVRYAAELQGGRPAEQAEEEGRRALAAETAFQKGEVLLGERDYEGALLCFGRAMENFPSEGEYRAHYGWALYLCHPDNDVMLGEALEHVRTGVKLAKDREKPYLLLGRLYKAMGKPVAAKRMFSRAVQIKPQCVEAMRELRIMNMRQEKSGGLTKGLGQGVLKKLLRR